MSKGDLFKERKTQNHEQHNLNEVIIAVGLAKFDTSTTLLTKMERMRLQVCENIAKEEERGIWGKNFPWRNKESISWGFPSIFLSGLHEYIESYISIGKK